jgi:hypothetical protein
MGGERARRPSVSVEIHLGGSSVVERSTVGVSQGIAEFAVIVDGTRRLLRRYTRARITPKKKTLLTPCRSFFSRAVFIVCDSFYQSEKLPLIPVTCFP